MLYGYLVFNFCLNDSYSRFRKEVSICCYGHGSDCWFITEKSFQINYRLCLTFGGMGLLPCVAVARVFALVMRCRIMRLLLISRVGKNRDTRRESPALAGAGRTADHLTVLFSQKVLAVRKSQWHIPTCCALPYIENHSTKNVFWKYILCVKLDISEVSLLWNK